MYISENLKNGSWQNPTIFCTSFASVVAWFLLPYPSPVWSCVMRCSGWWQPITSCSGYTHRPYIWLTLILTLCTNLNPLLISTIVAHVSAARTRSSQNASFVIRTISSHCPGYGYFYRVASLSHPFKWSFFISDWPSTKKCIVPTLTLQSTPLQGVHLGSPQVALILGLPHPSGDTICRGPPSVLMYASAPP